MPNTLKNAILPFLISLAVFYSYPAFSASDHISVDQITPGMDAYCLTVMEGEKVQKFPMYVISVIKNFRPGMDGIVVNSDDPLFQHVDNVQGCSGSPVFIDGKLAGALARGWSFTQDPLYIVTPIGEMMEIAQSPAGPAERENISFDFSKPLNLTSIERRFNDAVEKRFASSDGMTLPMSVNLPGHACKQVQPLLQKLGFNPVPLGGGTYVQMQKNLTGNYQRGGVLTIPMCSGDISLSVLGTVTEKQGDKVFGFGHSFSGIGPVTLPMAPGYVHTVVANMIASFKVGSPGEIDGTITSDQAVGVMGIMGKKPPLIPLAINVTSYNDPVPRLYDCKLAVDNYYTPLVLRSALMGAALMKGMLPDEHTIKYSANLRLADSREIVFENYSSQQGLMDPAMEIMSLVAVIMNNPFEKMQIDSIRASIDIRNKDSVADIWGISISDTQVEPGQTINIDVTLESYRRQKQSLPLSITIPPDLKPGTYQLQVLGPAAYQGFLLDTQPDRYIAWDAKTLITALQRTLSIDRNRLYAVLKTEQAGTTIWKSRLQNMPATKTMLFKDDKRLAFSFDFSDWIEDSNRCGLITLGREIIDINVIEK